MPFRLTNAPAICQAIINNTLRQYLNDFVIVYLDNILIYSENEEDHVKYMTKILEALSFTGMKINDEKSVFHVKEVEYLGYIMISGCIKMDSKKIQAIRDWLQSKTVTEI